MSLLRSHHATVADQGASFSRMASSREGRKKFVSSALDIVDTYEFDGVDIDWEFPAYRGLPPYDKENFAFLIKVTDRVV